MILLEVGEGCGGIWPVEPSDTKPWKKMLENRFSINCFEDFQEKISKKGGLCGGRGAAWACTRPRPLSRRGRATHVKRGLCGDGGGPRGQRGTSPPPRMLCPVQPACGRAARLGVGAAQEKLIITRACLRVASPKAGGYQRGVFFFVFLVFLASVKFSHRFSLRGISENAAEKLLWGGHWVPHGSERPPKVNPKLQKNRLSEHL